MGLVNLLRYITGNNNFALDYYSKILYSPLSVLLRHASINSENQFMVLLYYRCQDCSDTGRSTGSYIVFYQGGPIDNCTHVPGTLPHYSAESNYNVACNEVMTLAHFSILNNELMKKEPYIVPEQASLIILDSKLAVCLSQNGKDIKHTKHLFRRI